MPVPGPELATGLELPQWLEQAQGQPQEQEQKQKQGERPVPGQVEDLETAAVNPAQQSALGLGAPT